MEWVYENTGKFLDFNELYTQLYTQCVNAIRAYYGSSKGHKGSPDIVT